MRVLTGFPNYPEGRLYDGYRITWRRDEVVSGVAVRRVALFPSHGPSMVGRLANYGTFAMCASAWGTGWFKGIEAVWVHNSPPSVGLPTWLIKSRYRPRVVLHMMDLWPESLWASGLGGPIQRWTWLQQSLDKWLSVTYGVADAIACTTRRQIELLEQRGVPRSKLSHVPVWVDESIFYPVHRDEMLAASLGVTGKTVLLYAGAIGDAQGLESLIEVCTELQDKPRFHCLIAGTGVAAARLRRQAKDRRLRNVSFLGQWPANDMTRLMSVGDIHLVSLRPDPLAEVAMPSKVPATLACAKPLIVAALGDAANLIIRSGAGWACSPGDTTQLERAVRMGLAASGSRLQAMGRLGRQLYEEEFAARAGVTRVEQLLAGRTLGGQDVA